VPLARGRGGYHALGGVQRERPREHRLPVAGLAIFLALLGGKLEGPSPRSAAGDQAIAGSRNSTPMPTKGPFRCAPRAAAPVFAGRPAVG
jgi:hypothetical protein